MMLLVELLVWVQCCVDVETYIDRPLAGRAMGVVEREFVSILLTEDRWVSCGVVDADVPAPDVVRRLGIAAGIRPRPVMAIEVEE